MPRVDKRFTVLFSEEEILLLKNQALARGISSGELVRLAVQNEITHKSLSDRLNALRRLNALGFEARQEVEDSIQSAYPSSVRRRA